MIIIFSLEFLLTLAADIIIFFAVFSGAAVAWEWLSDNFIWLIPAYILITIVQILFNKSIKNSEKIFYTDKTYTVFIIINNLLLLITTILLIYKMQTFSIEHPFAYIIYMIIVGIVLGGSSLSSLLSLASEIPTFILAITTTSFVLLFISILIPDPFVKLLISGISAFLGLAALSGNNEFQ